MQVLWDACGRLQPLMQQLRPVKSIKNPEELCSILVWDCRRSSGRVPHAFMSLIVWVLLWGYFGPCVTFIFLHIWMISCNDGLHLMQLRGARSMLGMLDQCSWCEINVLDAKPMGAMLDQCAACYIIVLDATSMHGMLHQCSGCYVIVGYRKT